MMSTVISHKTLDLVSNYRICEAVGCFQKATIDIKEKVGQGEEITLSLCKYCVKKFGDK
jgi:hypothetical protein